MDNLGHVGKMMVLWGAGLFVVGAIVLVVSKIPGIGRGPLDILIQRGNFTFYFPVGTMIILSIILTLLLNAFFRK